MNIDMQNRIKATLDSLSYAAPEVQGSVLYEKLAKPLQDQIDRLTQERTTRRADLVAARAELVAMRAYVDGVTGVLAGEQGLLQG